METAVIDFLFSALAQLAAQYPDAAWLAVALSAVMTVCGLCAVATVWMPVPKETAGPYAAVYRWAQRLCRAFRAEPGRGGGRQIRNRAGRSQSRDGEVMRGPSYPPSGSPGGKARGWRQSRSWRVPAAGRLMALLCALLPGACGCAQWTGLALAGRHRSGRPGTSGLHVPGLRIGVGHAQPRSQIHWRGLYRNRPRFRASRLLGRRGGFRAFWPIHRTRPCLLRGRSRSRLSLAWRALRRGCRSYGEPSPRRAPVPAGKGWAWRGKRARRPRIRGGGRIPCPVPAGGGYGSRVWRRRGERRREHPACPQIGEVKAELSGLKAEVAGTNQRLDDIVITQLKDHGKRLAMQDIRISSLEQAENRRAGGISALAAIATVAGSVGALLMKVFG